MYIADYKKKGTVSKYPFFLPFFFCVPLGCFFLLLPVRKREKIPPTKWNPLLSGSLELVSPLQDFTSYSCSGDSDLWWSVSFSESKRSNTKGIISLIGTQTAIKKCFTFLSCTLLLTMASLKLGCPYAMHWDLSWRGLYLYAHVWSLLSLAKRTDLSQ